MEQGTSLAVQWLRLCLPMQGVWVQSLVNSTCLTAKKLKHKQKQYCNKFNKDFKNGPHKKKCPMSLVSKLTIFDIIKGIKKQ